VSVSRVENATANLSGLARIVERSNALLDVVGMENATPRNGSVLVTRDSKALDVTSQRNVRTTVQETVSARKTSNASASPSSRAKTVPRRRPALPVARDMASVRMANACVKIRGQAVTVNMQRAQTCAMDTVIVLPENATATRTSSVIVVPTGNVPMRVQAMVFVPRTHLNVTATTAGRVKDATLKLALVTAPSTVSARWTT